MAVTPESSVGTQFQGLPMADLIGGPLTAVCNAQTQLAQSSYDFIKKVGFEASADGDKITPRMIDFTLNKPAETPDGYVQTEIKIQAPFIGLVNIPSLMIEDVSIEFQMEVSATTSSKDESKSEAELKIEAQTRGIPFVKATVNMQGKVSSSRENTRSTNQTAKYQVRVNARQQGQTECMSRLLDMLAQCTGSMPTAAKT